MRSAFVILGIAVACLCSLLAADNNARVYKFRGLKQLWVGPTDQTAFTNIGPITINDNAVATPYPESVIVSSVSSSKTIAHITVVIDGLSHSFPDDVDMLLVAPSGTNIVLMSDCGGGSANTITNVILAFTDTATVDLPDATVIVSGTYRPTNYGAGDTFTPPAPSGSRTTTFNDFLGRSPNGTWDLYVMDDQGGDAGSVARGFYLIFEYQ